MRAVCAQATCGCIGDSSLDRRRNALRTLVVCAVALIAHVVPSFAILTGLTGGFGNNILGLIVPPLFYVKLQADAGHWEGITGARRSLRRCADLAACGVTFAFGVAFLVLSTVSFVDTIAGGDGAI